jgi:FtsP/CotA-like multicopper oxidase with cupredoxin domain
VNYLHISNGAAPRPSWRGASVAAAAALWVLLGALSVASAFAAEPLDPKSLTKYIDPLPIPGPMPMAGPNYYEIGAWEIHQQLHSQLPPTYLFGYGTSQATASYPAATIEARKGVPIDIHWTNHLGFTHPVSFAFDPTLEHAITTTGIPIASHVHGAEVEPQSDGGPLTWFTPGFAEKGPDWKKEIYHYVNNQLPATIWYHDHAMGYTRHNVYAGLAGFYIIRDPGNEPAGLPSGPYEIPLAIQDKMFTTDGQLWYPNVGDNPEHPVWTPEFFGNVLLVNGKIWPYLQVEPRKYRFRILDGSNARFYSLALAERTTSAPGPAFQQIGTDGGYLAEPVLLNDPSDPTSPRLLLAPGERADVVIDFSAYAPGTEFLLRNTAKAPYPTGNAPNPQTTGQVMLVRVVAPTAPDNSVVPSLLASVSRISNPTVTRTMTLNELEGENGPLGALLNGTPFMEAVTEMPTLGTTEMWEVVNMTADTHPIHIHLVQFQLLNRQKFNAIRYARAFEEVNPELPTGQYVPVPVGPYLKGKPTPADANERGWKDTYRMNPGEVTRILVRFAPQDESPAFAFDATAEPGYVWHCHILEHEENDMMRPYRLVAAGPVAAAPAAGTAPAPQVISPQVELLAPSPNPAAGRGTFEFSLPAAGQVQFDLYSVTGQRVRTLASGWFEAGVHSVPWDRAGDSGQALASGIYFVRLQGEGIQRVRKLVLAP